MATFNTNLTLKERLGSDLKFPIVGSFQPIDGLALLIQDIQLLLLTVPGERVQRPTWGCPLRTYIWENIDDLLIKGPTVIKNALQQFEPRITVNSVSGTPNRNTGLVAFKINFTVKATNSPVNLVFPFRSSTALSQA
jgi:phage baseplate assembly protein W